MSTNTNALTVADTSGSANAIRQDAAGRYCLNDLHRATGGLKKHRPNFWLENQQTTGLIAELQKGNTAGIPALEQNQPLSTINGGNDRGTYVVKELVYAYAMGAARMWISPSAGCWRSV